MNFLKTALILFFLTALTACGGSSGSSNPSDSNDADFDYPSIDLDDLNENNNASNNQSSSQTILVKGMEMKPAETILKNSINTGTSSLITGLVICDNSMITPNSFKNSLQEKYYGDNLDYSGFHKLSLKTNDDNCLVQSTSFTYSFPQWFYSEGSNTIYRKGKTAYIDMISTLAMARLMGTRSYEIIKDILEGQDMSHTKFPYSAHKGHFDTYRNELPSNTEYEAAELEIIKEIKATEFYETASTTIDSIINDIAQTDDEYEYITAYKKLSERAKLLSALYEIKNSCGYTCSDDKNTITNYSEGTDLKTIFDY